MRTKGNTRYFNQNHINKLFNIKNILFDEGKHNYSLDLVKKIISSKKIEKQFSEESNIEKNKQKTQLNHKIKLKQIINKLKILT